MGVRWGAISWSASVGWLCKECILSTFVNDPTLGGVVGFPTVSIFVDTEKLEDWPSWNEVELEVHSFRTWGRRIMPCIDTGRELPGWWAARMERKDQVMGQQRAHTVCLTHAVDWATLGWVWQPDGEVVMLLCLSGVRLLLECSFLLLCFPQISQRCWETWR